MEKDKLSALALSDTGFIFDPVIGETYTTNEVGLKIISLIKNNYDENEIVAELLNEFDADVNELQNDVEDFVRQLESFHLVSK